MADVVHLLKNRVLVVGSVNGLVEGVFKFIVVEVLNFFIVIFRVVQLLLAHLPLLLVPKGHGLPEFLPRVLLYHFLVPSKDAVGKDRLGVLVLPHLLLHVHPVAVGGPGERGNEDKDHGGKDKENQNQGGLDPAPGRLELDEPDLEQFGGELGV